MTHELSPEANERAEAARQRVKAYIDREALHLIVGVYDNGDDEIERK